MEVVLCHYLLQSLQPVLNFTIRPFEGIEEGMVTNVRVKICSRQEICILIVAILSLMLDWCCSASRYLENDEPASVDVCWREAKTSSS